MMPSIDVSALARKCFYPSLLIVLLGGIVYLSVWVRLSTISTPTVLDYDPWWFYRHAKMILENGFKMPAWDYLSFYPPGRPVEPFQGWSYTIALLYLLLKNLSPSITLTKAAIISPLVMVALTPIPAFFLGRILTRNDVGALATALFSTLTPAFIGVSMAGYCDTDAPVVFYSFLSVLSVILAIQRKSISLCVIAALVNFLFIFNWGGGWITLMLFTAFIPAILAFRVLESFLHTGRLTLTTECLRELKSLLLPLVIILSITNVLAIVFGFHNILQSFRGSLAFTGIAGQPLIVNISVAELQPINIFTRDGFLQVAGRVGVLPLVLSLFGIPALAIFKLWRRERISWVEVFLFLWALVAFYLISRGVRFSLLFSIAATVSSGYVVGNLWNYLKGRRDVVSFTVFALLAFFSFLFVSHAIKMGIASKGMLISKNWYEMLDWLKENADKDALVATWWDPGHILAGYTGLKVHADGAHCPPAHCVPYNHNIRIQDMGKIMTTSDEEEAIRIIKKYTNLTKEQCEQAKEWHKGKMPEDACKPVSEVYLIASNDLIGKYYWMSCFATFDWDLWTKTNGKKWRCDGRSFLQAFFKKMDQARGIITYCPGSCDTYKIELVTKEDKLVPVLTVPGQGIVNAVVKEIVYYQDGREVSQVYEKAKVDGLVWVDPSFSLVIYMDPKVRDSLFTTLFFWDGDSSKAFPEGKKLEHFKLVLKNPEIRLYKVVF